MTGITGAQPYFFGEEEEILAEIRGSLQSGVLTEGKYVERFETAFAQQAGTAFATAVSSGGAGLELILQAIGVEGKDVIVPTDTFVATAFSVIRAGGRPVFANIEKETLALSPRIVEPLVTKKTAAVIVVHMFGILSPELSALKAFCADRGIAFIEDAAHAHGAVYRGVQVGALGNAAAFSFYPTKIMTTGEGGMITTDRGDIAQKVRQLRNYGKQIGGAVFEMVGANFRLAEIPAILGYHQLLHLEENIERRNTVAKKYTEALRAVDGIELLELDKESRHSFWRFPLYVDKTIDRTKLQTMMAEQHGVRVTWMYEPLCHLQPALKDRYGYQIGDFLQAEECMRRLVCLPTHLGLSDADVARVIDGLKKFLPLCRV